MEVYEITTILLLFAFGMYGIYRDYREKNLKEYYGRLEDCRTRLKYISHLFISDCRAQEEKTFEIYTSKVLNIRHYKSMRSDWQNTVYEFINTYYAEIDKLKADYINNLPEKYSNGSSYRWVEDLPEYLITEYRNSISDAAHEFKELGRSMHDQLWQLLIDN